jgi:hypothetical protein
MTDTNELPQESKALSTLPAQLNNPPTPKAKSISDQLIPVPQSPMPRYQFHSELNKILIPLSKTSPSQSTCMEPMETYSKTTSLPS